MLVWIEATSAAIGVFAIFFLLLGVTIAEESQTITTVSEDMTAPTERNEPEEVLLSDLPFSQDLANKCTSTNNQPLQEHRAYYAVQFYNVMSHYANNYKEDAQRVLNEFTIEGCESQHLLNLPNTPALGELKDMEAEEALNRIYSSLLRHSAYSYFIHYQHNSSSRTCSRDNIERTKENNLATSAENLAKEQRSLACFIRNGIVLLGYDLDANVNAFLNERLTNLTDCSRRHLRNCQVMRSIVYFLNVISTYAKQ